MKTSRMTGTANAILAAFSPARGPTGTKTSACNVATPSGAEKNIYRVVMPLGTKEYVSLEKPSHTQGVWTDKSGLKFWHMQNNGALSANIRNVTYRNIYLRSPRNGFFADWETKSEWNRAIHPEVKPENYPVCEVRLEDVYSESPFPIVSGNESVRLWLRNVCKTRGPLINLNRDGVRHRRLAASFRRRAEI